jgi:dihydrofolate reductase
MSLHSYGELSWIFKSMDEGTTAWTLDLLWNTGVHIMGRNTFYDMASYWPYSTDMVAAPTNEIPKAVFSTKGLLDPLNENFTTRGSKDAPPIRKPEGASISPANIASWESAAILTGDLATC